MIFICQCAIAETDTFNDKIAFRKGAKDAFYNYIADNPRRYLVRKLFPEYFFHRLLIKVNDRLCGLYGNIFLLDNPIKSAIRISRIPERTPDYESKKAEWEEVIRAGGVIVSPFINPHEKKYRDEAIENGNGIILVTDYLFSDRKSHTRSYSNNVRPGVCSSSPLSNTPSPRAKSTTSMLRSSTPSLPRSPSFPQAQAALFPADNNPRNETEAWSCERASAREFTPVVAGQSPDAHFSHEGQSGVLSIMLKEGLPPVATGMSVSISPFIVSGAF